MRLELRLEVRAATVVYGRREALRGVDLSVGTGVSVLLGPNGAGKSTLLGALAGVVPLADGRIEVRRDDGRTGDPGVGYLPQEASLPRGVRLADVVAYAAWLQRVPRDRRAQAVDRALAAVRLGDRSSTRVDRLSGGMRRRALLACALVHEPEVLLLDEPTVGLDPEEQRSFRRLVGEFGGERIVLLSTHLLDDAVRVGETLLVLDDGRLRFTGTREQLVAGAEEDGRSASERLEEAYLGLLETPA